MYMLQQLAVLSVSQGHYASYVYGTTTGSVNCLCPKGTTSTMYMVQQLAMLSVSQGHYAYYVYGTTTGSVNCLCPKGTTPTMYMVQQLAVLIVCVLRALRLHRGER